MNEVQRAKARFAAMVEDGRKIEVFTSIPEYQWYIEHVVKPTIDDYTRRIMSGEIESEKQDWVLRGMVQGMELMTGLPDVFKGEAKVAKKKAKELAKYEKLMEQDEA